MWPFLRRFFVCMATSMDKAVPKMLNRPVELFAETRNGVVHDGIMRTFALLVRELRRGRTAYSRVCRSKIRNDIDGLCGSGALGPATWDQPEEDMLSDEPVFVEEEQKEECGHSVDSEEPEWFPEEPDYESRWARRAGRGQGQGQEVQRGREPARAEVGEAARSQRRGPIGAGAGEEERREG